MRGVVRPLYRINCIYMGFFCTLRSILATILLNSTLFWLNRPHFWLFWHFFDLRRPNFWRQKTKFLTFLTPEDWIFDFFDLRRPNFWLFWPQKTNFLIHMLTSEDQIFDFFGTFLMAVFKLAYFCAVLGEKKVENELSMPKNPHSIYFPWFLGSQHRNLVCTQSVKVAIIYIYIYNHRIWWDGQESRVGPYPGGLRLPSRMYGGRVDFWS